jgi:hypothetical protein
VSEEELAQGLASLGFRLDPSEMRVLLQHMDEQRSGNVRKSAFLASQLDWPSFQSDYRRAGDRPSFLLHWYTYVLQRGVTVT